jgi:NADP-reducing hydrogenase subunit HndB
MAKMTLEELRKLRESKKKEMTQRDGGDKAAQIIIGMGTCGIAAGAKEAFDAFLDELNSHEIKDTKITQTGCMGLCFSEPTVEVDVPGMPRVIYGNVDDKVARRIVREHIIEKALVSDHIFDKPAADIIKQAGE